MYEAFFGLRKRPFSATPDASCFFAPEPIQKIHDELLHRIDDGQGISILTGDAGTGKTLLCRKLVKELQSRFATVFLGTANFPTRRALLQAVLYELGQRYSGLEEQEFRLELQSHLKQLLYAGRSALLVIDEAHLLNERLLEEVRGIADLSESGQPLMRVVLRGPLLLEETLAAPGLQAFNERITCHTYLEPLTQRESAEYVEYRLKWAGSNSSAPFTPEALAAVAQASNGLPRCLNQLCDHSLLLAFVAENRQVTRDVILEALTDLKQLPLHWNQPLPAGEEFQLEADAAETDESDESELSAELLTETTGELEAGELEHGGSEFEAVHFEIEPLETGEDSPGAVCFEFGAGDSEFSPSVESLSMGEGSANVPDLNDIPRESHFVQERPMINAWNNGDDEAGRHHSLPFQRPGAVGRGEFEEEIVVDRYAQLDAGLEVGPGTVQDHPHHIPEHLELEEDEEIVADILPATGRPLRGSRHPRPDEIIDEIIPLLQEALDTESVGYIDEAGEISAEHPEFAEIHEALHCIEAVEATSLDVPSPEAVIVDEVPVRLEALQALESNLNAVHADAIEDDLSPHDLEVEEQLGAGVYDVCVDVQQEIFGRLAPLAPDGAGFERLAFSPMQAFSPDLVATEPIVYDVIEPELTSEQQQTAIQVEEQAAPAAAREELRRPNYKRVFSLLRRRQGNAR